MMNVVLPPQVTLAFFDRIHYSETTADSESSVLLLHVPMPLPFPEVL